MMKGPAFPRFAFLSPGPWAALWAGWVLFKYWERVGTAFRYYPAPFDPRPFLHGGQGPQPLVLLQSLGALAVCALVVAVALRWGSRTARLLGLGLEEPWVRTAAHLGLGILFLDLIWLSSGLNLLWREPLLKGLGFFLVLETLTRIPWGKLWDGAKAKWTCGPSRDLGLSLLAALSLFYLGFTLLHGLLPETFYDSMVYHLAVPEEWIQEGGITGRWGNFFSNYPYGGELFFLCGAYFQGTESARLLHACAFAATALAAGGWVRAQNGPTAGWLTAGLVLTLPVLVINAGTTQVEALLALPLTLAAYLLLGGGRGPVLVRWAAAALFLGLALSIKYTAIIPAIALIVGTAWAGREERARFGTGVWAAILGIILLPVLPWVLRNWALNGDPFFPYGAAWWGGRGLPAGGYGRLLSEQRGWIAQGWGLLLVPFRTVFSNPDAFDFVGPLALAFLPGSWLASEKKTRGPLGRLVIPLFFIVGFLVTHILRFLATGFVWAYVGMGLAWDRPEGGAWRKGLTWAAVLSALVCFGFLAAISARYEGGAGVWSGLQRREDFLVAPSRVTPYFSTARWVQDHTPSGSRLLLVGDARGLYYHRPVISNSVFDDQELARLARAEKDPAGMRERLREEGVDYLVVNGPEGMRVSADYHHYDLTPEEWKRLDGLIQGYTELVHLEGWQGVYRLLPAPKAEPGPQILDLALFFSAPASHFVQEAQRGQWAQAKEDLAQTLGLYPFSEFWRDQKVRLDQVLAARERKGG